MRGFHRRLLSAVLTIGALLSAEGGYAQSQRPALSTPESVGLDSDSLAGVLEAVARRNIPLDSLYIERNGQPVLDVYVYPFAPDLRHDVASVSKSVTALTIGAVFADQPDFGMNQVVLGDRGITLGDLLSMRSGLACGDRAGEPELFSMMRTGDWGGFVAGLPARGAPGDRFAYCSPAYLLASRFVSERTGVSLARQAERHLFTPLGIDDWRWPADPQGYTRGWGDLDLRASDLVKIGQVILDDGTRDPVIPAAWKREAQTASSRAGNGDGYGYGFWLRASVPGLVEARGRGGQGIIAWPANHLLVVMTASDTDDGQTLPLLAALRPSDGALPKNPRGEARLARSIAALTRPPQTGRPGKPGRQAARYMGRELILADQSWISRLKVVQSGASGLAHIESPYFSFDAPLGYDGVPRLGRGGPEDGAVAGSARWITPSHLRFEVRAYSLAQRVTFDLSFTGSGVRVSAREASGLFAFDTTAKLVSQ
jgi:CubicO group peptidase (beta-lactamase class C family)